MKELYKYRPDTGDFVFDILKNERLYFSTPNQFNDPFDAAIPYDYSKVSSGYAKEVVKRNSGNLTGDRKSRRKRENELYKRFMSQRKDFGSIGYRSQIEFVNNT